MRGWGIIITVGLIVFSGCKTGSKTSDENGRVPGEPASRPKTPQSKDPLTGNHWLDNPSGASSDATPPAGTWANPNDPNYDYKTEARGQLAGFVEDVNGRKIGNAYVRVEQSGGTQAKPYGVYTTADGSFLLPGLKPGASYTITVEARDQDRTLVGRAIAKAPNVRLRIPVIEGELPKNLSNEPRPDPPSSKKSNEKAPTSAIPSGELAPPPLWQGSKSSNDLPAPVPLGQDTKVFPARGSGDLPGDYSPTEAAPNWNAAPPIGGDPVPTVRPELMTGDKNPDWKAPTANIPPKPVPSPLPPERESKRLPRAEQFQLVDVLGRTRTFPSGRPGELILLDFMTTNCIPCQKMIPTLTALQEKYSARGLEVVAVTCDDESMRTRSAVADRYRKKYDLNYQLYVENADRPGPLLKRFNIERYPTVVLLNSTGTVVWQGHPSKTNELVAAIEDQLQSAGR